MDGLHNKSEKLLNKITKYCVLCITAVSSTQIVNLYQVIIFLIIDDAESNDKGDGTFHELMIISVHRALMTIDMLINVICLFLTTNYSETYYGKYCSGWHNCIKKCCNKCAHSNFMKKRTNKQLQSALLDEEEMFGY